MSMPVSMPIARGLLPASRSLPSSASRLPSQYRPDLRRALPRVLRSFCAVPVPLPAASSSPSPPPPSPWSVDQRPRRLKEDTSETLHRARCPCHSNWHATSRSQGNKLVHSLSRPPLLPRPTLFISTELALTSAPLRSLSAPPALPRRALSSLSSLLSPLCDPQTSPSPSCLAVLLSVADAARVSSCLWPRRRRSSGIATYTGGTLSGPPVLAPPLPLPC